MGKNKYENLDELLSSTKNQTVNVLKKTHSGIKKTGYLLTDLTEALYVSYIDPVIKLRMFFDKEYQKERKEYKQKLKEIFKENGYSKFTGIVLSHVAPMPIAEESKEIFAYFLGAFVVGGYEEWVIDAFAHSLHLDKNNIIKGSIYGEYFNNIISTVQIGALLKAGTFLEEYIGREVYRHSPEFVKQVGDFFSHISNSEIAIYTGVYALARYGATWIRQEIYENAGKYVPSPMRFLTPSTVHTSLLMTGMTKMSQAVDFIKPHSEKIREIYHKQKAYIQSEFNRL